MSSDEYTTDDEGDYPDRDTKIRIALPSGTHEGRSQRTTALLRSYEPENLVSQSMLRSLHSNRTAVAPEGSFEDLQWRVEHSSRRYTTQRFKVTNVLEASVVFGATACDQLEKFRKTQDRLPYVAPVFLVDPKRSKKRKGSKKVKKPSPEPDPEATQAKEEEMAQLMQHYKNQDNGQGGEAGPS